VCRPDPSANDQKHEIIASYLNPKGDPTSTNAPKYKEHTTKIMAKAHKLTVGKRIRLTCDTDYEVHVHCEEIGSRIFLLVAITSVSFGVHHSISEAFEEWRAQVRPTSEYVIKLTRNISRFAKCISNSFGILNVPSNLTLCKRLSNVPHLVPSAYSLSLRFTCLAQVNKAIPASDANASKGSLSSRVNGTLQKFMTRYNTSSLLEANRKVEQVKGVMRDNVDIALANAPKYVVEHQRN